MTVLVLVVDDELVVLVDGLSRASCNFVVHAFDGQLGYICKTPRDWGVIEPDPDVGLD